MESPGFIVFATDLTTLLLPAVALGTNAKSAGSASELRLFEAIIGQPMIQEVTLQ